MENTSLIKQPLIDQMDKEWIYDVEEMGLIDKR